MKIKIRTTFNFNKLADKIPEMIEEFIEDNGKTTVDNIRNIIDNRRHEKPNLGVSTLNKRQANKLGGIKYGAPKYGDIPLKYTGKLYDSLKATPKGVEGQEYTVFHHRGEHNKIGGEWVRRPKRSILKYKVSEEGLKKFGKNLQKNLKK
jgi:hypothetical protein